jgi:hypothetical protein
MPVIPIAWRTARDSENPSLRGHDYAEWREEIRQPVRPAAPVHGDLGEQQTGAPDQGVRVMADGQVRPHRNLLHLDTRLRNLWATLTFDEGGYVRRGLRRSKASSERWSMPRHPVLEANVCYWHDSARDDNGGPHIPGCLALPGIVSP